MFEDVVGGVGTPVNRCAWFFLGNLGIGETAGEAFDFGVDLGRIAVALEVRLGDDCDTAGVELFNCLLLLELDSL